MELSELIRTLEEIAPPELAEEMDKGKIGLIVPGTRDVKKVATALDPTPYVIKKAVEAKADALIVHHTLIWNPIAMIDRELALSLKMLLDSRMSLYSMHTNFDRAPGGVNDTLAALLGMSSVVAIDLSCAGMVEKQSLASLRPWQLRRCRPTSKWSARQIKRSELSLLRPGADSAMRWRSPNVLTPTCCSRPNSGTT